MLGMIALNAEISSVKSILTEDQAFFVALILLLKSALATLYPRCFWINTKFWSWIGWGLHLLEFSSTLRVLWGPYLLLLNFWYPGILVKYMCITLEWGELFFLVYRSKHLAAQIKFLYFYLVCFNKYHLSWHHVFIYILDAHSFQPRAKYTRRR